jgi:hypothetical protein
MSAFWRPRFMRTEVEAPRPERISVIDLRRGMRVKLLGQTYEVTRVTRTFANERRVALRQVGGPNRLDLDELEHPYATFEFVSDGSAP